MVGLKITSDLECVGHVNDGAFLSAELSVSPESFVSQQELRIKCLLAASGEASIQSDVKSDLGVLGLLQYFVR